MQPEATAAKVVTIGWVFRKFVVVWVAADSYFADAEVVVLFQNGGVVPQHRYIGGEEHLIVNIGSCEFLEQNDQMPWVVARILLTRYLKLSNAQALG